ncbi:fibronectin type III-like domain-contianing protein [candidate division KSB1 bacterium]|nr:fibronectin type III-like domain-contianing protein [candidate division KSB1 bacterium]
MAASVTRPVKELKGFDRIFLQPGESKTVSFELGVEQLSMLNLELKRVVEPGLFRVWVAPNSADGLSGEFKVVD